METVEFHPESGRTNLIFEHFPPGFQHVEKIEPNYRLYSLWMGDPSWACEGDLDFQSECGKLLPSANIAKNAGVCYTLECISVKI